MKTEIYDSVLMLTELTLFEKVLLCLIIKDNYFTMTNKDIAKYLQVCAGNASKAINKLSDLGYIANTFNDNNYRTCKITDKTLTLIN